MRFGTDSIGSFSRIDGEYSISRFYSDSLRPIFDYDTTRRLAARLIMDGGRGTYIIELTSQTLYTDCTNGVPMAENTPIERTVYDTIFVR